MYKILNNKQKSNTEILFQKRGSELYQISHFIIPTSHLLILIHKTGCHKYINNIM